MLLTAPPAVAPYQGRSSLRFSKQWPGFSAIHRVVRDRPEDALDLVGPRRLGHVFECVGWSPSGFSETATVLDSAGMPCAAAVLMGYWSRASVTTDALSSKLFLGLNLSYAVRPDHRGLGLGKLASYSAMLRALDQYGPQAEDSASLKLLLGHGLVSAQCNAQNASGLQLARSLGLAQDERLCFRVPDTSTTRESSAAGLRYLGFSLPLLDLVERAWDACSHPDALAVQRSFSLDDIARQRDRVRAVFSQDEISDGRPEEASHCRQREDDSSEEAVRRERQTA